jgi:hypothetical protein
MNDSMNLKIKALLKEIKKESFKPEYQKVVSEQECMGLLVSKYFEWDGLSVLEVARAGLTDSNFHTESEQVNKIIHDVYALDSIK